MLLDEFKELGAIEGFNDFLITCRGKRTAVVTGFQDIAGIEQIYGDKNAAEILACANNLAIFHINEASTKTTEWAANALGQILNEKMQINQSSGENGHTEGYSISQQRETYWMPSEFSSKLPILKDSDKLKGVYSTGGFWALNRPILKENLFNPKNGGGNKFVASDDPTVPAWDKLPGSDLPPACCWDTDDFVRLRLSPLRKVYEKILENPEEESKPPSSKPERRPSSEESDDSEQPIQDYEMN